MTGLLRSLSPQPTPSPRGPVLTFGWPEIDGMVELIAEQAGRCRIDTIVGIARSGLVPAVMLSHRMGVRPLAVLDIARTDSDEINSAKSHPKLRSLSNQRAVQGRRVLVIDDIIGGGLTMAMATEVLRDLRAEVITATLVINQRNLRAVRPECAADIVGCVVHGWVVFPWEGKPEPGDA